AERIEAATSLSEDDRQWLRDRHADLREQWDQRPAGLPECVVHGDAWVGNVALTPGGPVLLDFERVSVGPPEWDLVSTAVKLTTTGAVTPAEYAEFCEAYGADVTQWEGYELLAGARELRMTTYAAQHAAMRPEWQAEARYRVDTQPGEGVAAGDAVGGLARLSAVVVAFLVPLAHGGDGGAAVMAVHVPLGEKVLVDEPTLGWLVLAVGRPSCGISETAWGPSH
ncbi:phosphotransferase family protein, partial [Streptomyces sp. MCAF7]